MAEPAPLDRVRLVLEQRRSEIRSRFGAIGTGIGKRAPTDAGYVITVHLRSAADLPADAVETDGIPLQFVVTGEIRLQRPRGPR